MRRWPRKRGASDGRARELVDATIDKTGAVWMLWRRNRGGGGTAAPSPSSRRATMMPGTRCSASPPTWAAACPSRWQSPRPRKRGAAARARRLRHSCARRGRRDPAHLPAARARARPLLSPRAERRRTGGHAAEPLAATGGVHRASARLPSVALLARSAVTMHGSGFVASLTFSFGLVDVCASFVPCATRRSRSATTRRSRSRRSTSSSRRARP